MKRLLLLALLPLALVLFAPAAPAASPDAHGWWTSFAGPNPDVPSDGMLVQGGASTTSPSAFGAVVYSVPERSTVGKLTLAVAPGSASVPLTKLELCPLVSPAFESSQGGAMSGAPKFDCAKNVTAQPTSSGNTYEFDVSSLVNDGALAVAILPTSPMDRVALAAPDANSLAITTPPLPSTGSSATPPVPSYSPSYTAPTTPSVATPPAATVEGPTATEGPVRNAASDYVPTLAAGVHHARGAAVLLAIAGALVIGGGWLIIGRVSVARALAEGSSE
jgi:hypothetical protein